MAKPTDDAPWATDANYPAGAEPEAGTPTKVEPSAGKQALGHRPAEFPPAQYLNWWMNLMWLWIAWLRDQVVGTRWVDVPMWADAITDTVNGSNPDVSASGFTGYAVPNTVNPTGHSFISVDLPHGIRVDGLRIRVYGDAAGDILAYIVQWKDGVRTLLGVSLGTIPDSMISQANVPAAWTTYTITFAPHTIDRTNGATYTMGWLLVNHSVAFRLQSIGYRIAEPA